jgi:histidine ammonia-lyase
MAESRAVVERHLADGRAHYGINTGFGSLSRVRIDGAELAALQRNLVRSHAAGVGDPLPVEIVRALMVVLAASLARGRSGVRPVVVETLCRVLNEGVTPVVPSVGSVGASGDLAPLAHVALVLMGEGRAIVDGREMPGGEALARKGVAPLQLQAKEGLALVNGTHLMTGEAALLMEDWDRLVSAAVMAGAMSIDALRGSDAFLDERVYVARGQNGPAIVAARVRAALAGSQIVPSHRENDPRVQDPYSLRCQAVVLGAAEDAAGYVKQALRAELAAVTDNPLVFTLGDPPIVSAGNFHGMPVALPLDVLAIALAHAAGISERRTYLLTAASDPEAQLTPFLARRPGLQSGLMIAQYTAAACVNELIGLAWPASVANLPTCAGMEDYNSFGPRSASKARRGMELARWVVAIELLCAAEGVERHRPLRSGAGVEHAIALVRERVPPLADDRPLSEDIAAIAGLIAEGAF